jgi:ribosomal protein S18 acetylase RimI-like enzyme
LRWHAPRTPDARAPPSQTKTAAAHRPDLPPGQGAAALLCGRFAVCFPYGKVPGVAVKVEILADVTEETVEAFARLIPQLSRSAPPPDACGLARVAGCESNTVLVARRESGEIVGTLTLAIFPIPTGVRAWIEDVVVDEAAGRQGIGTALTEEALRLAREAGARTVDLTSRPTREAAGRLYERLGFQRRDSRLYRFTLDG